MKQVELVTYWKDGLRNGELCSMAQALAKLSICYNHPELYNAVIYVNGKAITIIRKNEIEGD